MLKIIGATKHFRSRTALVNATITLDRGEIVGLFGPSGAGKTTLLKCAMGLLTPDDGWPMIDGELLRPAAYEKLSFVTGEGSYFPDLSPWPMANFTPPWCPVLTPPAIWHC